MIELFNSDFGSLSISATGSFFVVTRKDGSSFEVRFPIDAWNAFTALEGCTPDEVLPSYVWRKMLDSLS